MQTCVWLDNRSVVPYCPYLSKHYNAHVTVEICSSVSAFKYLFKYVYKGGDRTTVVVQNDEIQDYVDAIAAFVFPPILVTTKRPLKRSLATTITTTINLLNIVLRLIPRLNSNAVYFAREQDISNILTTMTNNEYSKLRI
jgi:hypothetical protein